MQLNDTLKEIVRNSEFELQEDGSYKCSELAIKKLAYYITTQIGAMSFWVSRDVSIPNEVTDTAMDVFGLRDIP